MSDLISRQAAIDALDGNIIVTSRESAQAVMDYIRECADRIRSLPSAQPDLDSAYTEGYTAAESKYRKMWDEMQANIKEKAFGKRKGLVHTADIDAMPTIEERKTGKWVWDENGMDWNLGAWVCSECHVRNDNIPPAIRHNDGYRKVGNPYMWQGSKFCPNCGARMVQEGEDNGCE